MKLTTLLKARKAAVLQAKDDIPGAMALYEQAVQQGLDDPRLLLAYSVLLIRDGQFQKAKDLLVSKQKLRMTADQKIQLFMNYAVCCYKLGDMDAAVSLMERQHQKQNVGLVYQTLGYLYVEKYDASRKEAYFESLKAKAEKAAQEAAQHAAEMAELRSEECEPIVTVADRRTPEEQRQEEIDKALAFVQEGADYDDEDAVCLDNMGQFYYRVLEDKEQAKPWFEKAIAVREGQIDTLWFLSRYDLEAGNQAAAIAKLEKALQGRFSPMNYVTKDQVEAEIARLKA